MSEEDLLTKFSTLSIINIAVKTMRSEILILCYKTCIVPEISERFLNQPIIPTKTLSFDVKIREYGRI